MEQQTTDKGVYAPAILEFVTVAAEFCKTLEGAVDMPREVFSRVMRGLLPLLYLKATLLPAVPREDGFNAPAVTEADYDYVRHGVATLLGADDDYLDVFVEDFKYADQPVLCTVSESLADAYQSIRNFLEAYRHANGQAMAIAVDEVREDFIGNWGQCVLGALRVLHLLHFEATTQNGED